MQLGNVSIRDLIARSIGWHSDRHRSFSSRPPLLLNALRPPTNSWKSTVPPPLYKRSPSVRSSTLMEHEEAFNVRSTRTLHRKLQSFVTRGESLQFVVFAR